MLCAFVLAWASVRAYAAFQFFLTQSAVEHAAENGGPRDADLDYAQEALDRALGWFPRNPDYRDFSGQLKELRANRSGVVGRERQALLQSAANDYRRALAVRPLWPYGWVNLLSVKDKLGEVDSEFNTALRKAAATGPWEPRVQLQILRSGIRNWGRLTRGQRQQVESTLGHALQVQPREAFGIVRFYERPDLICHRPIEQPQIVAWCQKTGQAVVRENANKFNTLKHSAPADLFAMERLKEL